MSKPAKQQLTTVTNTNGVTFAVVLVPTGAAYGLEDCLTNGDKPMVEFYDTRRMVTEHGKFVSRYYVETLLPHEGKGLLLDMGSENWFLDAAAMGEAMEALAAAV